MFKSLLYKEWIKTRRVAILILAIFAGMLVYTFIDVAQMFRLHGAVQTWANVIMKDIQLVPSAFKWLPVMTGLLLAISQFSPEMDNKRLKLTLHLPMPETRIMVSMLAYGVIMLAAVFAVVYAVTAIGLSAYYPAEVVWASCWRILPWFLAGLAAYLLGSWVCLEPVWRYRISYTIAGVCWLAAFFTGAPSGAYAPFVPWLVFFILLSFLFPLYSAARFKEGAQ